MATVPPMPNSSRQPRRARAGLAGADSESDRGGPGAAGSSISRIPPHSFEAEESLLGAMLLSRDAIAVAVEEVSADDFYKPSHAHIFSAVTALYGRGEPADAVTVAEEMRRHGTLEASGGASALISLQANTPAISSASRYARIVQEHAVLRRLIGVAYEIAEIGYELPADVVAAVDRAEAMVFEVAQRRSSDSTRSLKELLAESLDHLEYLANLGETITGVATGYQDLDHELYGLQPSNLVVVGARPSMGKTAFALGLAAHAARIGVPVLFFSLEMSHLELAQRVLCAEARVDAGRLRNGKLVESDWSKIAGAIGRIGTSPLYIDDNPNVTVMDIRAKARRMKSAEGGLGLVIVDYLQLMTGRTSAESRQVEISEISRGLKILARELQIPVVALSQLSRNLESRADKRPILADLRECLTGDTVVSVVEGPPVTMRELARAGEATTEVWSLDDDGGLVPSVMVQAWSTGTRPVFAVRLAGGQVVRATANHPLLTPDGWTAVSELGPGTPVAVARPSPDRDIAWGAVEEIAPAGAEEVFDAHVPGTHSFVANGFVSHNSGAIEQDADVVMFIYRDEVYNPDSTDRGVAELLIAKHRNGPTGLAKLSFISNYARFGDLAKM
ncbi:MAG TPA: replicative DNA helicase [Acidimicrobiales bacterium]|nr:replicative DNA helicase [Acidimicrobiales bacterium]